MNWYLQAMKKYAVFEGRARRTEYWMFILFNMIFASVAFGLDYLLGLALDANYGIISLIYTFAVIVPSISVLVRRLHDTGKSAWYMLITFIPLIGSIWLLILLFTDGDYGANQYGENPKESV